MFIEATGFALLLLVGHCTQHLILDRVFLRKKNALISIVGEPGSGKSWAAMRYCQKLTAVANREYYRYFPKPRRKKTWTIDKNLMFRPREFFSKVRLRSEGGELENGDAILCDEWHLSAPNREFMSLINRRALGVISTFRVDRFIVFFTLPLFSMQDPTVQKLMTAYIDMVDQGKGTFYLLKTDHFTGKQYRGFRETDVPGVGMAEARDITLDVPSKKLVDYYELRKRELVTEVKGRGLEAADIAEGRMRGRVKALEVLDLLNAGTFPVVTDDGKLEVKQRFGILLTELQKMFPFRSVPLGEARAALDAWMGTQGIGSGGGEET